MTARAGFVPLVIVVGFHHARGPEVETWYGAEEGQDPARDYGWELLPFMALSDGAHAATEDFSYFTLLRPATAAEPATSLFGISCTRQIDSSKLIDRSADVTRSTVQKAVVVVADSPQYFGILRERLSAATAAWFAQHDFTDDDILRHFQESLQADAERGKLLEGNGDRDQYLGMSLRRLVREFKWQMLVLFKCCLLQPKMLFFGTRCERLCMMQFSLISLIPGLIRHLQDCASTDLKTYETSLVRPTSVRTSERTSLLAYMGVPLQIFGSGSLFGPYTPLQQLDILADLNTKSYIVGSTNALLLQQKDRYSDILINLDESTINITSPSLRTALSLSIADRRWIDFITQSVNDTWDEAHPDRPKTMGYVGSEAFIRLQFEEYLLALLSSSKCHSYMGMHALNPTKYPSHTLPVLDNNSDPITDFGTDWHEAWSRTDNYRIWSSHTQLELFDIVEPKHPCAGGLTIEDVRQRVSQQVAELHLDERFEGVREGVGKTAVAAREGATRVFNKLYDDLELLRENQRRRAEDAAKLREEEKKRNGGVSPSGSGTFTPPDLSKVSAAVGNVGVEAGKTLRGWGSWIGEKRKNVASGWGATANKQDLNEKSTTTTAVGSGASNSASSLQPVEKSALDTMALGADGSPMEPRSPLSAHPSQSPETAVRPGTMESYASDMFDAESPPSPPPSVTFVNEAEAWQGVQTSTGPSANIA